MSRSLFSARRVALALTAFAVAAGAVVATSAVVAAAPTGDAMLAATTSCTQYTTTSYGKKAPVTATDVTRAQTAVVALVNSERKKRGLRTLCLSPTIRDTAAAHAQNWRGSARSCPSSPNWFGCGHWDSRAGLAWPGDRMAASGFGPCANNCIGENTYNGGGVSDGRFEVQAGMNMASPEAAVYWWMNHNGGVNGHRDAILRADFTSVGVGVATYTDQFGNPAAAYVLNFGKR
jgi:uncharacterized protein YkwD